MNNKHFCGSHPFISKEDAKWRAVSYSSNMLRRTFLQTLPAAAAMTAAAAEESPVKLGFDTYSVRAFKWKGTQLLDYAAGLKLDTIQFSALGDYGPLEPQNLQKLKDRAKQKRARRAVRKLPFPEPTSHSLFQAFQLACPETPNPHELSTEHLATPQ